ncbi:MAG: photosynthetic reaction center subunit H [Lautropia sp.]
MPIGAITSYIDVAQVVLYVFWIFFAALVYYLLRENKREGYPLHSDRTRNTDRLVVQGFPKMPRAKVFRLADGREISAPLTKADARPLQARPVAAWPGAPLVPIGDPMQAGVGPGTWTERADAPDLTFDGQPRIVPMRLQPDYRVASEDPDPVGMPVIGADGRQAATIVEVWVDRAESVIRFFELALAGDPQSRVLLPSGFARLDRKTRAIHVRSLLASQFRGVPARAHADSVTLREEERIMAYYGAGTLYATPARQESLL